MRRARYKTGSVVFDKRRSTWNFLYWADGKRRSKLIGSKQEFPTKSAAQQAAQAIAIEKPEVKHVTVRSLVEQYRIEKMPKRFSTRRSYEAWLNNRVLPRWGDSSITELQARPVELWLHSL